MLTMWDVGGSATKLWKHYFDKIDAIMFVIDAAKAQKDPNGRMMEKSKAELHKLCKDPALQKVPVVIMINKIDLADEAFATGIKED